MREIVSVFGLPDKPCEVDIPNGLVSAGFLASDTPPRRFLSPHFDYLLFDFLIQITDLSLPLMIAHINHVPVQCRVPILYRLPTPGHDERTGGMACEEGQEAGSCCWCVLCSLLIGALGFRLYSALIIEFTGDRKIGTSKHPPGPSPLPLLSLSFPPCTDSFLQKPRNMLTSPSSSTAASRSNLTMRRGS